MTPPKPSSAYRRKFAKLDGDTQAVIRAAEADIAEEPNMNRLRRRTTRGTILDYGAHSVGYAIEYAERRGRIELDDLLDLG